MITPPTNFRARPLSNAWPDVHSDRRVLLAECDAAGGDIASGYLRGTLDASRGLLALAAQRSANPVEAVWQQVLALDEDGKRLLLRGLTDPSRASAIAAAWSTLGAALDGLAEQTPPIDVLLDFGRMRTVNEAALLRRRAALVLLVTGSSLSAVVAARAAVAELRAADLGEESPSVAALIVGEGRPYKADEISKAVGLPLVGTLPYDPVSAAVFSHGAPAGRRFPRSPLVRSARALASALLDGVSEPTGGGTTVAVAQHAGVARG